MLHTHAGSPGKTQCVPQQKTKQNSKTQKWEADLLGLRDTIEKIYKNVGEGVVVIMVSIQI